VDKERGGRSGFIIGGSGRVIPVVARTLCGMSASEVLDRPVREALL
jgi:hypothetical protein